MEINGKRILILGAYGQVGQAIARMILRHYSPGKMILSSLYEDEANEVVRLAQNWAETFYPGNSVEIVPESGNMLQTNELQKIFGRLKAGEKVESLYSDRLVRFIYREYNEFSPEEKMDILLYRMLTEHKPEIVIDCVNTSTGLAYQDIFGLAKQYIGDKDRADKEHTNCSAETCDEVPICEKLLMSASIPGLVRHIEILKDGMEAAESEIYVKVGTTGTGGMGLNIPYTHSESKPSRTLMSKSSLGGAASLLYLLMNRTAGGPVIKEIKPASLIGWKSIGFGEIIKRGSPIPVYDCPLEKGLPLKGGADFNVAPATAQDSNLEGVFIDTGENGVFSAAEFEAITSLEQMELVTAEDVARAAVEEIRGESTGFDVVGSLSAVIQDSTYRGGVMRNMALGQLDKLAKIHGETSVAYELLGPPRLSKLLWEAQLLKLHGNLSTLLTSVFQSGAISLDDRIAMFENAFDATVLAEQITAGLAGDEETRSRIISIGLPICTPDLQLAFGPTIALMRAYPSHTFGELIADPERRQYFLENGAVVIMPGNLERWRDRIISGIRYHFLAREGGEEITSSGTDYRNIFEVTRDPASGKTTSVNMQVGELIGWIFVTEEKGSRRRHYFSPNERMG